MVTTANYAPKRSIERVNKIRKEKEKSNSPFEDMVPLPPALPGDDFATPSRECVRPDNQLMLSKADLDEEVSRMLTANNLVAPKNMSRYNLRERCYKFEPMVDQTMSHYVSDGWLLYRLSEEAKKQLETERFELESCARFQADAEQAMKEKEAGLDMEGPDDSRQLRNQFNFSERAAQTLSYATTERSVMTEPLPTATASGSCSLWEIYDEYLRDVERQKLEDSHRQKVWGRKGAGTCVGPSPSPVPFLPVANSEDVQHTADVLERMVNQNMFEEVSMDFKYWEDTSDIFRLGSCEGSLLPLWKFHPDKGHRQQVTAIDWNPQYMDLFAVGYGSYDYLQQGPGRVCIFTLKNPTSPYRSFWMHSGVLSLHFNPDFSNLLAVGCYDGTVLVIDIYRPRDEVLYKANTTSGKHSEPVWQVHWQVDESQRSNQFVSVSSDGLVTLWTLSKGELQQETLMVLHQDQQQKGPAPDMAKGASVGGCCLEFCKGHKYEHLYLVGTEKGAVHACSKAFRSEYLHTYNAHQMAVYAVHWNPLHHQMFLSASEDWTICLWDYKQPSRPLMTFDLQGSVEDAAWAPYSSTTFAAVTEDGQVHVYDLHKNPLLPLCSQKVSKAARLTRLAFNPKQPVVLVGDSKGNVLCLKLSPNLRIQKMPDGCQNREAHEMAKLDKVVETAEKRAMGEGTSQPQDSLFCSQRKAHECA